MDSCGLDLPTVEAGVALSRTSRKRGSGSPPAVVISPCRDDAGQRDICTAAGVWPGTTSSAPWLQYPGAEACTCQAPLPRSSTTLLPETSASTGTALSV